MTFSEIKAIAHPQDEISHRTNFTNLLTRSILKRRKLNRKRIKDKNHTKKHPLLAKNFYLCYRENVYSKAYLRIQKQDKGIIPFSNNI